MMKGKIVIHNIEPIGCRAARAYKIEVKVCRPALGFGIQQFKEEKNHVLQSVGCLTRVVWTMTPKLTPPGNITCGSVTLMCVYLT